MKRLVFFLGILAALGTFMQSCDDTKTYAELLDDEKGYIKHFVSYNGISTISEANFDPKAKMADNEYVLFKGDGLYLHIDSVGIEGPTVYEILDSLSERQSGVRMVILTRFLEYSIQHMDTTITNFYANASPEQFYYVKSASSYSSSKSYGSFFFDSSTTTSDYSMQTYYGTSVPGGWLKALEYVGDGGRVKIIVPSKTGHSSAMTNVLPFYYELHFQIY